MTKPFITQQIIHISSHLPLSTRLLHQLDLQTASPHTTHTSSNPIPSFPPSLPPTLTHHLEHKPLDPISVAHRTPSDSASSAGSPPLGTPLHYRFTGVSLCFLQLDSSSCTVQGSPGSGSGSGSGRSAMHGPCTRIVLLCERCVCMYVWWKVFHC
jgi:hypothetical protein